MPPSFPPPFGALPLSPSVASVISRLQAEQVRGAASCSRPIATHLRVW